MLGRDVRRGGEECHVCERARFTFSTTAGVSFAEDSHGLKPELGCGFGPLLDRLVRVLDLLWCVGSRSRGRGTLDLAIPARQASQAGRECIEWTACHVHYETMTLVSHQGGGEPRAEGEEEQQRRHSAEQERHDRFLFWCVLTL